MTAAAVTPIRRVHDPVAAWVPGAQPPAFAPADIASIVARVREPVHVVTGRAGSGVGVATGGDVALVLKRLADARRDGDQVVALLDEATADAADLRVGEGGVDTAAFFGTAHAAKGLVDVAAAALMLRHRAMPRIGAPADPSFGVWRADVVVTPLEAPQARVRLRADTTAPWVAERPPRLHVFSGADQAGTLAALAAGQESPSGPARLVIVAADAADLAARASAARTWLSRGGPQPDGVAFRAAPITGEVGFVFTGGMAAYPGMGRELLLAFPGLIRDIEERSGSLREVAGWAFAGPDSQPREVLDQIWGTALLSQVHAAITRDVLGLAPQAALGYSAGESNALVALGVWTDMSTLVAEMTASGMFSRQVAGDFAAIRRSWQRQGIVGSRWKNYLVGAPAEHVRKALDGEVAAHLIAVNAPDSCIVGGDVTACERALSRLDADYTLPIPYELAVHVPELAEVRDDWWRLHHRPTTPPHRLLGCELTFHGSPPVPGETLRYEIHIDDHAEHHGIRLFFFHYDCYVGDELRLTVRSGQAGFFTDAELAGTAGVIWDPETEPPPAGARSDLPVGAACDPPAVAGAPRRYDAEAVRAFAGGRPYDCFGDAWDATRAHVRSPRIEAGQMLLLGEVSAFDPVGGPWRRGYLRAETPISPDDWYFSGHFKNDPCMPGTLMFQGCLQAMAFYLTACGFTIGNDAWRFEPVPGESYPMRCRGQATPDSRNIRYEVFVSELVAGPEPTLHADVLCTVDGVTAFHARRVGLRLVPDWPLDQWRELAPPTEQETGEAVPVPSLGGLVGHRDDAVIAESDGVRFDYGSLLACAWGRPSQAFGELYSRFDSHRRVARLPGPPYHFMTRIASTGGRLGGMEVGSEVVAEYDVPDRSWYWEQNGQQTMPLSVLMEVALQPCGWLASYVGCAVEIDKDLLFRNLDGTATITGEITPGTKVIRTHARLRDISIMGTMIIVSFDVECFADDVPIFSMDTVFGFFPPEAFVDQPGLPASDEERAALGAPVGLAVDLTARPARYCDGLLRLAGPMLLMLDRITGYDPAGGEAGLGRITAEKDVDAGEWFFKAHFFQDPVQPGSLGIEAMYQALQFYLLERDAGAGMAQPRFELLTGHAPLVWKYRGQVVPTHGRITTELEITEFAEDADGRYARAKAWLWVDGRRIYSAVDIGVRVVPGTPREEVLDLAVDTWLGDHRPTWTVPVLPMMSALDRLAGAAGGAALAVRDVKLRRWIPLTAPARLKTELAGERATLLAWRDAATPTLSRFEPVATATVGVPGPRPAAFAPLADAMPVTDIYTSGALFHGPAFQYLTSLRRGSGGASGVLDAGRGTVPRGIYPAPERPAQLRLRHPLLCRRGAGADRRADLLLHPRDPPPAPAARPGRDAPGVPRRPPATRARIPPRACRSRVAGSRWMGLHLGGPDRSPAGPVGRRCRPGRTIDAHRSTSVTRAPDSSCR